MAQRNTPWLAPVTVADLHGKKRLAVDLQPDAATRAALATDLGIPAIRKLRLTGEVTPASSRDWLFQGQLGATVLQECVVTLDPVTTRIEEPVMRLFVADYVEPDHGSETEMPEDDTTEALGTTIDPGQIMAEALALALPPYPRKEGVELDAALFTEPGQQAMTDEDARPFAGLAALKKSLSDDAESDG